MCLGAGSPDGILLVGFRSEKLKPYTGKTLAEAARLRGKSPEETAMDLIVEDESRVDTVYFTQSKDNLQRFLVLPWVSFCSDSPSIARREDSKKRREAIDLTLEVKDRTGNVARLPLSHYSKLQTTG